MKEAEQRLQSLMSAIDRPNRFRWALQAKAEGKKVIGVDTYYVPEEIVYAAGMFPWRLVGAWEYPVDLAKAYWHSSLDLHCASILETILRGELDFLDGAIVSDFSEDTRHLGNVLAYLGKPPFVYRMHVPNVNTPASCRWFYGTLDHLKTALEWLGGAPVTREAIANATRSCDAMRGLLRGLYELRKRPLPPLTGGECFRLTAAAVVMGRDAFVPDMSDLMPYLAERRARVALDAPRVLLSSDNLFDPAYVDVVERAGCVVAMDDSDPGSRYFWQTVDGADDVMQAIARRYLGQPAAPRAYHYEKHLGQVSRWVREFSIDGVINLPQLYDMPRVFSAPRFAELLTREGIPNITIGRDYRMSGEAQMLTRVQAFLETLAIGDCQEGATQ